MARLRGQCFKRHTWINKKYVMERFVIFCNFFLLFFGKVCGDLSLNNIVDNGCIVEETNLKKQIVEQKSCVFPFSFNEGSYNECTNNSDVDQRYWCSTKVSKSIQIRNKWILETSIHILQVKIC